MTPEERKFDVWYGELVALGVKYNWPVTDPEGWQGYFNDEYTPMDALCEDISYGVDG